MAFCQELCDVLRDRKLYEVGMAPVTYIHTKFCEVWSLGWKGDARARTHHGDSVKQLFFC